jgi:HNH endonuclease
MQTLLSSPARLRDKASIDALRDLFLFHGALGHRAVPAQSYFSEVDRLRIVPMVFGLLPKRVLFREHNLILVKPLIREHLAAVGVPYDEAVVDVLKSVGDQYFNTDPVAGPVWYRRGKWGIGDLKAANRRLYVSIRREQEDRCAACGIILDDADETLDHCVPWRLIGDVMDGSNWQLLCAVCNVGKREFLSTLQSVQSLNWIYGQSRSALALASSESRYAVLTQRARCEVSGCAATAASARLELVTVLDTGLPVVDNLTVRCEHHAA